MNARKIYGLTPILICAKMGHLQIARALIDKGADVNAKTIDGVTPLHYISEKGDVEFARALIEMGADVNAKRNEGRDDGKTPLDLWERLGNIWEENQRNVRRRIGEQ